MPSPPQSNESARRLLRRNRECDRGPLDSFAGRSPMRCQNIPHVWADRTSLLRYADPRRITLTRPSLDPTPLRKDALSGPALSLGGLRKAFADVVAVDGIDLEVAPGECFGLLGPNGAGKTTTIEICEGLTTPDEGTVELLGLNWQSGAGELRQRIGIQLQETQCPDKMTVEETLRLFRSFYRSGITVDESIKLAQLEEKRKARVGGLSGGQKQRLAMATALVGNPELLFLDEPTTGLDPQARRHLWDLVEELKRAGRTIILTTHYMEEAEQLCDRVAIMDHGKVIALGTPNELIAKECSEDIVEFAVNSLVPKGEGPGAPPFPPKQSLDGAPRDVVDVEAL